MPTEQVQSQFRRVVEWLDANASKMGLRVVSSKRLGVRHEIRFEKPGTDSHVECWFRPNRACEPSMRSTATMEFGYRSASPDAAAQQLLQALFSWLQYLEGKGVLAPLLVDTISGGPEETLYQLGGDSLELRVTHLCNECCSYCSVNRDNVPNTALDYNDAIRRARAAAEARVRRLVITGGEPTLLPWLMRFLVAAASMGFASLELQTNGTQLARENLARRLRQIPGLSLFISLPGMDPATVAAATGKSDLFEAKLAGIHAAAEAGLSIQLNHVVYAGNLPCLTQFPGRVRAEFGDSIQKLVYSVVSPSGRADARGREVVPRYRDVAPELAQTLQESRRLGFQCTVPDNCGMPVCVLPMLCQFAEPHDSRRPPHSPDKEKFAHCPACRWNHRCSGVFTRYLDLYGSDEFRGPLT